MGSGHARISFRQSRCLGGAVLRQLRPGDGVRAGDLAAEVFWKVRFMLPDPLHGSALATWRRLTGQQRRPRVLARPARFRLRGLAACVALRRMSNAGTIGAVVPEDRRFQVRPYIAWPAQRSARSPSRAPEASAFAGRSAARPSATATLRRLARLPSARTRLVGRRMQVLQAVQAAGPMAGATSWRLRRRPLGGRTHAVGLA